MARLKKPEPEIVQQQLSVVLGFTLLELMIVIAMIQELVDALATRRTP